MKLPSSPEANQKQNAIIVVVQNPATMDATLERCSSVFDQETMTAVRAGLYQDLGVKLIQWADYATCFLLADQTLAADAPELTDRYERLEFTGDAPGSFREGLSLLLEAVWDQGFRRIVFVDAFAPSLPADRMRDAFEWLWERDVVAGPSVGGGCYLVGLRDTDGSVLPEYGWYDAKSFFHVVDAAQSNSLSMQILDFGNVLAGPQDIPMVLGQLKAQAAHGGSPSVGFDGIHTWNALADFVADKPLGAHPTVEWLVGDAKHDISLTAPTAAGGGPPESNGTHSGGSGIGRRGGRHVPGTAPAPQPSDIPPRRQ